MNTHEILLIVAGLCGLTMVTGGIFLLYKGAISLHEHANTPALSIDYKRTLRFTTHYPALGLFIIGLLFVLLSLYFSNKEGTYPVTIEGSFTGDIPSEVSVVVVPYQNWMESANIKDQKFQTVMPPFDTPIKIMISSNEREPSYRTIGKNELKKGIIKFNSISLPKVASPIGDAPPDSK